MTEDWSDEDVLRLPSPARAEQERPEPEEDAGPARPSPVQEFPGTEVWVELTDRGAVRVASDGWVHAFTDPGMLPGGQLEGYHGDEGLDVSAVRLTGERLRGMVGDEVGIVLDRGYASQVEVQLPPVQRLSRPDRR